MKVVLILFILACLMWSNGYSQQKWTLQKCIDFGLYQSISVNQSILQSESARMQLETSKAQKIPSLTFSSGVGSQFGRSIDPTTNSYTNTQVNYQNATLSGSLTLFNWFSNKNTIKANEQNSLATKYETEKLKNDLKINITAAYLQLLLSLKQIDIAKQQINIAINQLDVTTKLSAAGKQSELYSNQLHSQLQSDSSDYYDKVSSAKQAQWQLMALMNLNADSDFEPDTSMEAAREIPVFNIDHPQKIYEHAVNNQPLQLENESKMSMLKYKSLATKAAMLPTLSASGNLGSNYSNKYTDANGDVLRYSKQMFDANLWQSIGLTINVPILNHKQLSSNYEQSLLNIRNQELQQTQDDQTLKQNIFTAYNNAKTSLAKYQSSIAALKYSEEAFSIADKRFNGGILSISDYFTALNSLYTARINKVSNYFDYIFHLKVLEYYY